jgi:hypothetical protein
MARLIGLVVFLLLLGPSPGVGAGPVIRGLVDTSSDVTATQRSRSEEEPARLGVGVHNGRILIILCPGGSREGSREADQRRASEPCVPVIDEKLR